MRRKQPQRLVAVQEGRVRRARVAHGAEARAHVSAGIVGQVVCGVAAAPVGAWREREADLLVREVLLRARVVAEVGVEAAVRRRVRVGEEALMPLAQCPGGVARTFLEEPRHEAVLEVDATRDARHRVEVHVRLLADVPGVAAREDLRARRAAEPVDVVLVEDDGLGAKLVQLRCADLPKAVVPAHVVPAQVVHEREDDVGPLCRRGLAAEGCGQRSCEDDDGLRCGRLRS